MADPTPDQLTAALEKFSKGDPVEVILRDRTLVVGDYLRHDEDSVTLELAKDGEEQTIPFGSIADLTTTLTTEGPL